MLRRIKIRLDIEDTSQDRLLDELLTSSIDTICLYVQKDELPRSLESIAVSMTVDAYNRLGTEGSKSESKGSLSQSFYDDCLIPYEKALDQFILGNKKRVIFA